MKERINLKKQVKKIALFVISLTALFTSTAMAADLSGWALGEYQSANESGLVSYNVVSKNLKDNITREELCELVMNLYRKLTNEDLFKPNGSPFVDTNNESVTQAYLYGIVSGTGDGTFDPQRLVTRQEMAKMLVSTLAASEVDFKLSDGSNTSVIDSFADGYKVSDWAKVPLLTALENSLMNGIDPQTLDPLGSTTREQAIASVNRFYKAFKTDEYSVELPTIVIPQNNGEVEDGDFNVEWTPISTAQSYRIIIKDASSRVVYENVVDATNTTITKGTLKGTNQYSLTVGAVLADGSEVYSMPVDFTYKKASTTQYLASNPVAQAILIAADTYLGVPYVWGGTTPKGFDCSGFVQYVYSKCGISLSRTTYTQCVEGTYVSKESLQPGDLVFFGSAAAPNHVGIYVGNNTYIHAPRTGDVVKYASLEYRKDFCYGRRIIN